MSIEPNLCMYRACQAIAASKLPADLPTEKKRIEWDSTILIAKIGSSNFFSPFSILKLKKTPSSIFSNHRKSLELPLVTIWIFPLKKTHILSKNDGDIFVFQFLVQKNRTRLFQSIHAFKYTTFPYFPLISRLYRNKALSGIFKIDLFAISNKTNNKRL